MDISAIDKNFKIETDIKRDGLSFYDVKKPPFVLNGVFYDNGLYRRLPENIAKTVSDGVAALHANTAGGTIRFKTNSTKLSLSITYRGIGRMSHFPLTGSAGFDMFVKENGKWICYDVFIPPYDTERTFESHIATFPDKTANEILIYFPLYSEVKEVFVGIDENADIFSPSDYAKKAPFVFYGSSITQGGCASRPGNAYSNIVSRMLDCGQINLGFSGNGMGEKEIADYIANLDMSAFILDYDHNAPTAEHLKATHERFLLTVREKHPDLPIVMMTRPKYRLISDDESERIKIITDTYENAIKRGDKNIALIKGSEMITEDISEIALVDGCHPNDCGFTAMAFKLIEVLKKML